MNLEEIWEILKRCCGASDHWRDNFIMTAKNHLAEGHSLEYRFRGSLGFGGKVWIEEGREPRVTCYPEDETPARRVMIDAANAELLQL